MRWHQGRQREAYVLAKRCLAEAERYGDPGAIARGYEMLALACHSLGEWAEGQQYEVKRDELGGGYIDVTASYDLHL